MKKSLSKVVSLAIALVMCLALGTTAFAANATGTEAESATATIVKELQIPAGTTTPTATFKFTATSETADAPTIATKEIAYSSSDTATDGKIIKNLDLFGGAAWAHAGVYVYTVKEIANTYTAGEKETMTYSQAEYKLTVVVANGTSGLYVKEIAAQLIKNDSGDSIVAETKVDPNPDPSDPTNGGIRFINTFVKGGAIDPNDPNSSLMSLDKTVAGDIGDKTKAFAFTISASNPAIAPAADQTIKARIYNADNTYGDELTIGSNTEVSLKHGQKLVFMNLYAGANISFKETDAATAQYDVSATVKNGTADSVSYNKEAVTNTGVSINGVSESKASATVTNTLNSVTPTGILLNNLPFILMIVIAAAGFVAYISIKRRRSAEN